MQSDNLRLQGVFDLGDVAVIAANGVHLLRILLQIRFRVHLELPLARAAIGHDGEVVETQYDVLRRHDDRRAVGGMQNVVRRHHEDAGFELRLERERHVHGHLVAVEVGIECRAHERMQLDRLALDQHWLEGLNAEAMQRGRTIEQHGMLADDLVENVPDLGLLLFDQLLRLLDCR